ncbi:hypothetical protein BKA67DRAFT_653687 [Truncatella angustata]|uniref:Uncharacterized protein n=1 Tax=Truncatella angustata TaxID=152316 RepID=A0A9P9A4Q2_9PEZI|nr:uncharacterized protein BKA67DRAFT_653687 [Truncatella angustata]KAH6660515.1 hypothetical protein BKA67DRAFT_653687 [Truncatella angustata]
MTATASSHCTITSCSSHTVTYPLSKPTPQGAHIITGLTRSVALPLEDTLLEFDSNFGVGVLTPKPVSADVEANLCERQRTSRVLNRPRLLASLYLNPTGLLPVYSMREKEFHDRLTCLKPTGFVSVALLLDLQEWIGSSTKAITEAGTCSESLSWGKVTSMQLTLATGPTL